MSDIKYKKRIAAEVPRRGGGKMTDDKGAFELGDKLKLSRDSFMTLETETKTAIANAAYAAGRKAERERCLAIANRHPDKCDGITLSDCMETIKDEIRGGQDGK